MKVILCIMLLSAICCCSPEERYSTHVENCVIDTLRKISYTSDTQISAEMLNIVWEQCRENYSYILKHKGY